MEWKKWSVLLLSFLLLSGITYDLFGRGGRRGGGSRGGGRRMGAMRGGGRARMGGMRRGGMRRGGGRARMARMRSAGGSRRGSFGGSRGRVFVNRAPRGVVGNRGFGRAGRIAGPRTSPGFSRGFGPRMGRSSRAPRIRSGMGPRRVVPAGMGPRAQGLQRGARSSMQRARALRPARMRLIRRRPGFGKGPVVRPGRPGRPGRPIARPGRPGRGPGRGPGRWRGPYRPWRYRPWGYNRFYGLGWWWPWWLSGSYANYYQPWYEVQTVPVQDYVTIYQNAPVDQALEGMNADYRSLRSTVRTLEKAVDEQVAVLKEIETKVNEMIEDVEDAS